VFGRAAKYSIDLLGVALHLYIRPHNARRSYSIGGGRDRYFRAFFLFGPQVLSLGFARRRVGADILTAVYLLDMGPFYFVWVKARVRDPSCIKDAIERSNCCIYRSFLFASNVQAILYVLFLYIISMIRQVLATIIVHL
jgi:hypothetical protein